MRYSRLCGVFVIAIPRLIHHQRVFLNIKPCLRHHGIIPDVGRLKLLPVARQGCYPILDRPAAHIATRLVAGHRIVDDEDKVAEGRDLYPIGRLVDVVDPAEDPARRGGRARCAAGGVVAYRTVGIGGSNGDGRGEVGADEEGRGIRW